MHGAGDAPNNGRRFEFTNGIPTQISLLHGRKVASGGELEIIITNDKPSDPNSYAQFNWRCEIKVPNGGIQEYTNKWQFFAPTNGYQPTAVVAVKASDHPWQISVERMYFIRLSDGKYARMNIDMSGRNPVCSIESFINPNGSPNLEYERYKEIRAN